MKKIIVILAGCLLLSICGCSNGENENISNEATIENVEEGTLSEDEKIDEEKYQTGIEEYNNKKYQNALDIFSLLKDYKESDRYIKKCKYEIADNMCEMVSMKMQFEYMYGLMDIKMLKRKEMHVRNYIGHNYIMS